MLKEHYENDKGESIGSPVGAEWSSVMTRQLFLTSTCSHREGPVFIFVVLGFVYR